MEKLAAHCLKAAPPIRQLREEIPLALAEIVQRTLAKKAEDRYATPAEPG